jgi:hypothetical protein
MSNHARFVFVASLLASSLACGGGAKPQTQPELAEHSLAGLAAQRIVLLPTYSIRVMPGLAWAAAIGRPVDVQRILDADLLAAFDERGLRKTWIFPEDLQQSFKRNASYAADPYTLAEEPLRSPALNVEQRLPEPLASQLRTLVALHENARLILAPVEVRFEPMGSGPGTVGRAVLRLVLVDPRLSRPTWIGEVVSDSATAFGPVISASLASKVANLVAIR